MRISFIRKVCFMFLALIFMGCASPIKKLHKKPDKYHQKKVVIKGEVISSIELSGIYSFTIKDKTGKMMVITENLLPLKNDKIRVKGIFDKNFEVKGKNSPVVREKKMKEKKPADARKKIQKILK
jgi:hypothetical protein